MEKVNTKKCLAVYIGVQTKEVVACISIPVVYKTLIISAKLHVHF